jgi:hypothetical protein
MRMSNEDERNEDECESEPDHACTTRTRTHDHDQCMLCIVYCLRYYIMLSLFTVTGVRGTKKKAHHQQDTFLVIFARTHQFQAACTDNIRHQHLTGLRLPAAGLPIKIAKNRMQ